MSTRLVYGFHAVASRLSHDPGGVQEICLQAGRQDVRRQKLEQAALAAGVRVVSMEGARLDGLVGHGKHQGVVARVTREAQQASLEPLLERVGPDTILLVLDGVKDPHNLGACLRVADALGAAAVVLPRDRSAGLTATVEKVASGAAQTVPLVYVTNLARSLDDMKECGLRLWGAHEDAELALPQADLRGPIALVMGAEGEGMRRLTRERCDGLLRIPMLGTVGSLNVSVAAALCLYEARRQRAS